MLEQGVAVGDRVCVLLPRSEMAVATILAVLKVGAAYVPIDVAHPAERIGFVLTDSTPTVLVTTTQLLTRVQSVLESIDSQVAVLDSVDAVMAAVPPAVVPYPS
ncbi:AMP-binding protein, partial [Nocardia acididurans]|uniref:AMP-binding protein n=1 Tax=Nocardia acididurans TaxID=2802282 RepID=UPI001E2A3040